MRQKEVMNAAKKPDRIQSSCEPQPLEKDETAAAAAAAAGAALSPDDLHANAQCSSDWHFNALQMRTKV